MIVPKSFFPLPASMAVLLRSACHFSRFTISEFPQDFSRNSFIVGFAERVRITRQPYRLNRAFCPLPRRPESTRDAFLRVMAPLSPLRPELASFTVHWHISPHSLRRQSRHIPSRSSMSALDSRSEQSLQSAHLSRSNLRPATNETALISVNIAST